MMRENLLLCLLSLLVVSNAYVQLNRIYYSKPTYNKKYLSLSRNNNKDSILINEAIKFTSTTRLHAAESSSLSNTNDNNQSVVVNNDNGVNVSISSLAL